MNVAKRHPSSTITAIFAVIALAFPFVDQFRDATAPVGVPAELWVKVSAAMAGAVVLGQLWQQLVPTIPVKWTVPAVVGFLGSAAAFATPMIATLADKVAPLNVPNRTWVVLGSALAILTLFGKVMQAVAPGWQEILSGRAGAHLTNGSKLPVE